MNRMIILNAIKIITIINGLNVVKVDHQAIPPTKKHSKASILNQVLTYLPSIPTG